jgi:uncharacterized membrane protein
MAARADCPKLIRVRRIEKGFDWLPPALVGGLLSFGALRVLLAWAELPRRMASHFGPSGAADGFMSRDGFMLVMALVSGVPVLLSTGVPALIRHMPNEAINMPNRDYWLSPERRERSISRLSFWLGWLAVPIAALLVLVVDLTLRANVGRTGLDMSVFGAGFVAYVGGSAFVLIAMYRDFRVPRGPERAT